MIFHFFKKLREFFSIKKLSYKHSPETFILYKIVKSSKDGKQHTLQCANTRYLFKKSISEIVYDNDLLFSLPPLQACGIGIHFAKLLTTSEEKLSVERNFKKVLTHQSLHRYGSYCLHYQTRSGKIFFVDVCTEEGFFMDPKEIALSKTLISQFDASEAFYIGFSAGLSMRGADSTSKLTDEEHQLPPYLRVVK